MDDLVDVYQKQLQHAETQATVATACRVRHLRQLQKMLKDNEDLILSGLEMDLGKSFSEGFVTELGMAYQSLKLAINKTRKWNQRKRVRTPFYLWPAKSWLQPAPYGQVLIIDAFNYPLLLAVDPLIGALSAGNVAMVALSEQTPHFNKVMIELSRNYLAEEVVYFFEGNKERNQQLLEKPFGKIFFTGSQKVGKSIMAAASNHLTPVTLELGGKSPAIVTASANVRKAAEQIAWGKFINTGQTCVAPDYCLVDRKVLPEFKKELINSIHKLYGDNPSTNKDFGRIVSESGTRRLGDMIEKDREYLVHGGEYDVVKKYIAPTILEAELNDSLATMAEEIFGPILPLLSYDDLSTAQVFLRKQDHPLAFYPFSKDKKEVNRLLAENNFGGGTVNDTILHLANHHLPFGGVGASGMGNYHGKASFDNFSHYKSILKRYPSGIVPIMQAPYSRKKDKWLRFFMK